MDKKNPKITDIFTSVILIYTIILGALSLLHHYHLITSPGQLEYRESSILSTTDLLLKGENPYALKNLPQQTNVYGLVYNFVVLPFAKDFGTNFVVHRIITAVFIFGSVVILYLFLKWSGINNSISICGALIFYILLVRSYTTIARPDSLGLFLFLLSIIIPWRHNYSHVSLGLSIIIGILAFLTKPYFLFGIPCVALYLFLSDSKIKGIIYIIISLLCASVPIFVIHYTIPYYWHCTYFHHVAMIAVDFNYMIEQSKKFIIFHIGLILIITLAGIVFLSNIRNKKWSLTNQFGEFNFLNPDKPLLSKKFGLITAGLISALIVLTVKLGWNTGAYMIYYYHLATPLLLIYSLNFLKTHSAQRVLQLCFILLNLIILNLHQPVKPQFTDSQYQDWQTLINSYEKVYSAPPLIHFLVKLDKPIYDNGQTEYFAHGIPDFNNKDLMSNNPGYLRVKDYVLDLRIKIYSGYFDLVLLARGFENEFFDQTRLIENYRMKEVRYLPGYFSGSPDYNDGTFHRAIEVWVKKNH